MGEKCGEGTVTELKIHTHTLLYLKQITNKDRCTAQGAPPRF